MAENLMNVRVETATLLMYVHHLEHEGVRQTGTNPAQRN